MMQQQLAQMLERKKKNMVWNFSIQQTNNKLSVLE